MGLAGRAVVAAFTLAWSALGKGDTKDTEWHEQKQEVDWLHIPKTGTSFGYILLLWKCEYLEKFLTSPKALSVAASWAKDPKYMPMQRPSKCVTNFNHFPLRKGVHLGHSGHRVGDVFTMLRSPLSRDSSGFAHVFEACRFAKWIVGDQLPFHTATCEALAGDESSSQRQEAEKIVMAYGRCVSGCQTNLVGGFGHCGNSGHALFDPEWKGDPPNATVDAMRITVAKAKLRRFSFVGLTE